MSRYQVFDSFQDAVFVIDAEGKSHYGNDGAANLTGVSTKRLSGGRPLSNFLELHPDPILLSGGIEQISDVTQLREVGFSIPSQGKHGWAQVTVQAQPDHFAENEEEKRRWIVYVRDVSLEKILAEKYRGELEQKEGMIDELKQARAALEEYSKNLEKMVEERTGELKVANGLLKTVLDSLGQGIFAFGRDGRCLPIYSQVCRRIVECDPPGMFIEDVLRLSAKEKSGFEQWRDAVFDELLDFEDMVPLAQARYAHTAGLEISLDYHPMRDSEGRLSGIIVVATDRTLELRALKKAEKERELVTKVTQVAKNREAFRMFVIDARRLLGELKTPQGIDFVELTRRLHTLKGAAASFALQGIAMECHHLEDELKAIGENGDRTAFDKRLGEQAEVVLQSFDKELSNLSELLGPIGLTEGSQVVEVATSRLREWSDVLTSSEGPGRAAEVGVEIHRQISERAVAASIQHLRGSLGELASGMGKKFDALEIENGDMPIPGGFAQGLLSSLVHAFSNAIYHGLETPEERKLVGKPEGGTIRVKFDRMERDGRPWLSIVIRDDGRGVNAGAIRKKLAGLGQEELAMRPDEEIIQVILRDDFSTSSEVNTTAGRGVGLAAIAGEVKRLAGKISVRSETGKGMTLDIAVPLPTEASSTPSATPKAA